MATVYDITDSEVPYIRDLADLQRLQQILTIGSVNTILLGLVGEFKAIPVPQQCQISSGVVTVERLAVYNWIEIDTQGGALPLDDVDSIAWSGTGTANVGDKYLFFLRMPARRVNFTSSGNFKPKNGSFELSSFDSIIEFTVAPSLNLVETNRYPQTDTVDTAPSSSSVYVTANSIPAQTRVLSIVALTGETLAQGQIQITAATGTVGSVAAWINEGDGTIQIGTFSYSTASSTAAVAAGLALDITNNSQYSAIATGADEVVITARPFTGSSANFFVLQSIVSGGVTTIDTAMGVIVLGSDGSETDEDIDTLQDGEDGPYYLKNGMATNVLTLVSGGNLVGSALPLALAAGDFVEVLKLGSNISVTI